MKKIFFRGLLAITPIIITFALIAWIFSFLENAFSKPIKALLGEYYFTGFGVIIALILIFFVGIIINNFVIQKLYSWAENLLKHIPLVKTLYNSVSELMSFFRVGSEEKLGKVVLIEFVGASLIGFVTRETFDDLSTTFAQENDVVVYVPFSYQIGGYTFIVSKDRVRPIDMSVDEAMRFAITAGVLKHEKKKKVKE